MDSSTEMQTTLYDRLISRVRLGWILGLIVPLLYLPLLIVAYFEGSLENFFTGNQWHGLLLPPTVILYILIVASRLARMQSNLLTSIRPVVLIDEESFGQLVRKSTEVRTRDELIAIGVGLLGGFLAALANTEYPITWLSGTWVVYATLMYALLAWTVYISLASTRLTPALMRQPLRIDLFDITPFEVIGRQSLLLALVFVGGITLSVIFLGFGPQGFKSVEFWLSYIPPALVPAAIFFVNMAPTHQVLARAKKNELDKVQGRIRRASRDLLALLDQGQTTGNLPGEINALAVYEQHVQSTRTWPYNTGMLRTLFFSVLIPAATAVGRIFAEARGY